MQKLGELITNRLMDRFVSPGPYYTSYPTLGEWSYNVRESEYLRSLEEMADCSDNDNNALYIHFPYCPKLCYFCICNVTVTHDRSTINRFLQVLLEEIDLLFSFFEKRGTALKIRDIHLGGGTPSYLQEHELVALVNKLSEWIDLSQVGEFAIEFDPRSATESKFALCRELGFNRVSMGIQDFRPEVQEAVNRVHSFELVQSIMSSGVRHGFSGFNFDLLYGLPLQTRESFQETLSQVSQLAPERITLLKYAHVPDVNKHMKVLDKYPMADDKEKAWMFMDAIDFFTSNGWEQIGIDHFARPDDSLAIAQRSGNLKRGFIGFASGGYDRLLGVGPSSTMKLDNAYYQNLCNLPAYTERVSDKRFPILSGYLMQKDDLVRRDVIEQVLCQGFIDKPDIESRYGLAFDDYFAYELASMEELAEEGIIALEKNRVSLSTLGNALFKRHVAKCFDHFLRAKDYRIHGTGNKKHL